MDRIIDHPHTTLTDDRGCKPNLTNKPMIFQVSDRSDDSDAQILNDGDIYDPEPDKEAATSPRARQPMKPKKFVLLETPYICCLRYETFNLLSLVLHIYNRSRLSKKLQNELELFA